jgi:hypothetical protein
MRVGSGKPQPETQGEKLRSGNPSRKILGQLSTEFQKFRQKINKSNLSNLIAKAVPSDTDDWHKPGIHLIKQFCSN